jgi:hypothetical protein
LPNRHVEFAQMSCHCQTDPSSSPFTTNSFYLFSPAERVEYHLLLFRRPPCIF